MIPTLVPPEDETIEGTLRALRKGTRTCVDVLESCLARIDEWEPRVRAWVLLDRVGARAQARQLDTKRTTSSLAPLFGIPIGVKDIVDVAGLPTAGGFAPWADRIASEDAPIVDRLRRAGAIILGKTVTTTFAWIDPPPTRNPWNLERTPGGSSSGSAAALACGMVLGAIGSQTGGSITRPASFCGVAGMKPSYVGLPREGIVPLAPTLDHAGMMAPTVRDLELLWCVMREPMLADVPCRPHEPPRVGRLRGFFDDRADPSMREAIDHAFERFRAARIVTLEIELPEKFEEIVTHHRRLMATEAAAYHEQRFAQHPDAYPPRIRALIEEGLATSGTSYARSRQDLDRARREGRPRILDVDVLATPAALGPAPDATTTGDPVFNSPWSYTGLPTVTFPIAVSADNMPLGIQLIGRRSHDNEVLAVARRCEAAIWGEVTG
jgi:aspartyl-tRNA(Asn)/glutamyl-tRNA(Gln) amidotransferase subunit A